MKATKPRLYLERARQLADKLITRLAPSCARIEVAGSIRRGKPRVGDIELVVIPRYMDQLGLFGEVVDQISLVDQVLDGLINAGHITRNVPPGWDTTPAWGERYRKFWLRLSDAGELAQVDLFITTPESWGAIFTIRTGPSSFSEALVTHIKNHTPYRQQGGVIIVEATGEVVPIPEERDYFELVGLPYIEPAERTAARLWQLVHRKK